MRIREKYRVTGASNLEEGLNVSRGHVNIGARSHCVISRYLPPHCATFILDIASTVSYPFNDKVNRCKMRAISHKTLIHSFTATIHQYYV